MSNQNSKSDGTHYSDLGQVGQVIWDILSLANHLQEIRQGWAKQSNVTGPQWLILFAISTMSNGKGVPVGKVSEKLHVKSTFVTTQTKILEKAGLVRRSPSHHDKRVVLLALTPEASKRLDVVHDQRADLHKEIFGVFTEDEFSILLDLVKRLEISAGDGAAIAGARRSPVLSKPIST